MNGISEEKIRELIKYLKGDGFDAGIITTFESTATAEQLKASVQKSGVKERTKAYFNDLPNDVKAVHEAAIVTLLN